MTFPQAFELYQQRRSSERERGWLIVGVDVIGANGGADCAYRNLMRMALKSDDASLRLSSAQYSSQGGA
ncbi:hypothetical protein [Paraburkholderia sp. BL6665CI2N2]|uniref:hypothetical protein n=1 Tax=Paraburkholderia sp. BL6665CI2N2 TaxID=1938806 RepID=UPI001064E809|nr:hypothetical protein [Paraburkholderia sp. BL6665CI2N2]